MGHRGRALQRLQGAGQLPISLQQGDEVLVALDTKILFIQGTRDNLCPLDLLAEVRGRMQAPSQLFVVDDGDHSLQVAKRTLKKNDETQDDVDARILDAVRKFVAD